MSDIIGECWDVQFYEKQKKQRELVQKYYDKKPKVIVTETETKTLDSMATEGIGMIRLVLRSGDRLPEEFENEHPIITETAGETIVYWFKRTGLKRIK